MTRITLPPAPGESEHPSLVLANSRVLLPGGRRVDELESPDTATAWLIENGLVPSDTTLLPYCQNQLAGFREALRDLFRAQVEGQAPPAVALQHLNSGLIAAPAVPILKYAPNTGFSRVAEHPTTLLVEHAIAQLAEDAAAMLSDQQVSRLAQCAAAPCDRFLLRTHARRHWCSTRCGDRVRAARAYERRQRATAPA
ncbi:hypothetical protein HOW07_13770 [Plantibacter sp. MCCC 1A11337]|uniref:CGNR zinc finger domain-containing protein n=1 Tax=unclassified Plantibacter TaxID=2624265 RepID=UPI001582CA86|nr:MULTISPECIES: ABATE domain-containing protein [unclassified Plantibacter]MBD8518075.1 ABATE domain-containing protein [Plantibacter sp. CFBP 8804]NUJ89076.1 hypothetical protein [Plantibacter sp. MCCC 1A11337]